MSSKFKQQALRTGSYRSHDPCYASEKGLKWSVANNVRVPDLRVETAAMLTEKEISQMLVGALKDELKARGASTAGKKADLSARLWEIVSAESQQSTGVAGIDQIVDAVDEQVVDNNARASDSVLAEESVGEIQQPVVSDDVSHEQVESAHSTERTRDKIDAPSTHSSSSSEDIAISQNASSGALESVEPDTNARHTHVRIENFQRPLNPKALLSWLEAQCECTLQPESLWINSIKTHCYVDFSTHEEAERCIKKVTGQRYPTGSPYILAADFTNVSAKDAPTAPEAARRPGEWKVSAIVEAQVTVSPLKSTDPPSVERGEGLTVTVAHAPSTDAADDMDTALAPTSTTAGTKRSLESSEETGPASPNGGVPTSSSGGAESGGKARRLLGGFDIFRRATAGIWLGKPGQATGIGGLGQPSQSSMQPPTVVGQITRTYLGTAGAGDAGEGRGRDTNEDSAGAVGEKAVAKGLDELFRKTTKTVPALYWLPAPDEVVQARLKNKLKLKGTMGAKK